MNLSNLDFWQPEVVPREIGPSTLCAMRPLNLIGASSSWSSRVWAQAQVRVNSFHSDSASSRKAACSAPPPNRILACRLKL